MVLLFFLDSMSNLTLAQSNVLGLSFVQPSSLSWAFRLVRFQGWTPPPRISRYNPLFPLSFFLLCSQILGLPHWLSLFSFVDLSTPPAFV